MPQGPAREITFGLSVEVWTPAVAARPAARMEERRISRFFMLELLNALSFLSYESPWRKKIDGLAPGSWGW
jgi:hypothetical protein